MIKRRFLALLLAGLFWVQMISAVSAQSFSPYLVGASPYLKFREISQAVGCDVLWNGEARQITLRFGTETAVFTVDSNRFLINGTEVSGDHPVALINGTSYLALTDVNRILYQTEVIWNLSAQFVDINLPSGGFRGFSPKKSVTLYSYDGLQKVETTEDCIAAYGDGWHLDKPALPYPLILVNRDHPIPSQIPADQMIQTCGTSYRLYADAAYALNDLMARARQEGVTSLVITSAFRDAAYQKRLFDGEVARLTPQYGDAAAQMATLSVAYPGTSEHETGLAVDIGVAGYGEDIEHTAAYQWLYIHAAEYGFIVRYPKDKTEITHTKYEPWHFRYVGPHYAQRIQESGLCYEEYFDTLYFQ